MAEKILPMCIIIVFYDNFILVLALLQDANKGGGKLSQPEGSGKACQRGKSELGPEDGKYSGSLNNGAPNHISTVENPHVT